jgi:hypothetical protein
MSRIVLLLSLRGMLKLKWKSLHINALIFCAGNGWTCLIRNQMVKCMIMSCCWEYVCVRLDKMHEQDWIKWGNYVSAKKSKSIIDSKVADDYWIGSNMDCVDDLWVGRNLVFVNDFCINSGTCALMNSMLVANQFSLLHCIVNNESVFDVELWCQ